MTRFKDIYNSGIPDYSGDLIGYTQADVAASMAMFGVISEMGKLRPNEDQVRKYLSAMPPPREDDPDRLNHGISGPAPLHYVRLEAPAQQLLREPVRPGQPAPPAPFYMHQAGQSGWLKEWFCPYWAYAGCALKIPLAGRGYADRFNVTMRYHLRFPNYAPEAAADCLEKYRKYAL